MSRVLAVLGVALFVSFVGTSPAWSANNSEIVEAIQTNRVYVEAGLPGTDRNTTAQLARQLHENDRIAVVLVGDSTLDPEMLIDQIDQATGNELIIALVSSNTTLARSSILPAGQAEDLMQRSVAVSTNDVEILVTFIRYTHSWQASHPDWITTTTTQAPPSDASIPWVIPAGGGLFALVVLAAIIVFRMRRRAHNELMNSAPRDLRPLIARLMSLRKQVQDPRLREAILNVCRHSEQYFKRVERREKGSNTASVEMFERHLTTAINVVERYIDISQYSLYYDDPNKRLLEGASAIEGLSLSILESVRKGNRRSLTAYTVDTKILSAQRYR